MYILTHVYARMHICAISQLAARLPHLYYILLVASLELPAQAVGD